MWQESLQGHSSRTLLVLCKSVMSYECKSRRVLRWFLKVTSVDTVQMTGGSNGSSHGECSFVMFSSCPCFCQITVGF